MKGFFETLFLAGALAFVGWGIINIGMKFEIKVNGRAWGITIGGPDEKERALLNYLQIYNGYQETYYAWADRFLIDLPDRDNCLRYLYPQFENIGLIGTSENSKVFFIVCSGKKILDFADAMKMNISYNYQLPHGYTVL